MIIFKFIFTLFCFAVAHLIGHAMVFNNGQIYELGSFTTTEWMFFILYYSLAASTAIVISPKRW